MKTIDKLILASIVMLMQACNQPTTPSSTNSASANRSIASTSSSTSSSSSSSSSAPQAISVTAYSLSRTDAPISGWPTKTYSALGSCAIINSKTYCWSDGVKTLQWTYNSSNYGPYKYDYFNVQSSSGGAAQSCSGGCTDDYLYSPVKVTSTLLTVIPSTSIQDVFNLGNTQVLSCTQDSSGNVTCGSLYFAN